MKIDSLLNPAPNTKVSKAHRRSVKHDRDGESTAEPEYKEATARRSKTRDGKDTMKLEKGDPTGQVRFPPYTAASESSELRLQHQRHHMFPIVNIKEFPCHIPYSSAKKDFYNKTGRESFEVFEYAFKFDVNVADEGGSNDHDKGPEWVVRWDYNIGLVRVTPFFKALGLAKTAPAKAITESPDLMSTCHSITGGSLTAQGYWIPYAAAKALAATFCWPIRYALTPLFGPEFIDQCLHPDDPAYTRYAIDQSIVKTCIAEIKDWKAGGQPGFVRGKATIKQLSAAAPKFESFAPRPQRKQAKAGKRTVVDDDSDDKSMPTASLSPSTSLSAPPKSTSSVMSQADGSGWNAINRVSTPGTNGGASSALTSLTSSPMQMSSTQRSPPTKRTLAAMTEDDMTYSEDASGAPLGTGSKRLRGAEVRAARALIEMRYRLK